MPRLHTYIRLNKTELNELVSFMKGRVSRLPPDLLARRRAQAIWFSHHGKTVQEISRKLRVSLQAIWSWLATYRRHGIKGLIGQRGSSPQLTFEQLYQLRGLRHQRSHLPGRSRLGLPRKGCFRDPVGTGRADWTYPRLARWVKKMWNINISSKRLGQMMKQVKE